MNKKTNEFAEEHVEVESLLNVAMAHVIGDYATRVAFAMDGWRSPKVATI